MDDLKENQDEKLCPPASLIPREGETTVVTSNYCQKFSIFDYWKEICGVSLFALTFDEDFPRFLCGLLWGVYLSALVFRFIFLLYKTSDQEVDHRWAEQICTTEAPEEELLKVDHVIYKGWMNLLNGHYNPSRFHAKATSSVLIKLDREVLRLSIPKTNIAKHSFWNESKVEPTFVRQELYNLAGAEISVRPKGLARRRWWSRKYPICISLAYEAVVVVSKDSQSDTGLVVTQQQINDESDVEFDEGPENSPQAPSVTNSFPLLSLQAEMETEAQPPERKKRKNIYLFARSKREKEQWFHQLRKASVHYSFKHETTEKGAVSESEADKIELQQQVLDWMLYASFEKKFQINMEALLPVKSEPKDVMCMDLSVETWKHTNRITAEISAKLESITWANALAARIFMDFSKDPKWIQAIKDKIDQHLNTVHLPYFIETLKMAHLETGVNTPKITGVYQPNANEWGLWVDVNLEFSGGFRMVIETKLNLMKLKADVGHKAKLKAEAPTKYFDEDLPESPESSDDEHVPILPASKQTDKPQPNPKESVGKKFTRLMDKITQSKRFQNATENRIVKKIMKDVSDTKLILMVDVVYLEGTMALNIPTPPSDRIWIGFRCPPKVILKARPKVGEQTLNLTHITDWIENKLCFLLEKFLVVPNMADMIIPLLSGSPLFKNMNK